MDLRAGLDHTLRSGGGRRLACLAPAGFVAATPMVLFAVQLVLNIAATTATFFRSLPVAGWLMTPYLIWVSSAVVLNFTIWGMSF